MSAADLDLAVVIPVYNEEACIAQVVESWRAVLDGLGIEYRITVYNDGSKDGTAAVLERFADQQRVQVVNKANSGHGPTILGGYREAAKLADWTFQCDSDDEMPAEAFVELWRQREEYDALFGVRRGIQQNIQRKLISMGSRAVVRLLFGSGVADVNTPYRLLRSPLLARIVEQLPDDTFAPNVIISGVLARNRRRILNIPVDHRHRRTGKVSITNWGLYRGVLRSFWQTVRCSRSIRL